MKTATLDILKSFFTIRFLLYFTILTGAMTSQYLNSVHHPWISLLAGLPTFVLLAELLSQWQDFKAFKHNIEDILRWRNELKEKNEA